MDIFLYMLIYLVAVLILWRENWSNLGIFQS